jgi:hypothetical protein
MPSLESRETIVTAKSPEGASWATLLDEKEQQSELKQPWKELLEAQASDSGPDLVCIKDNPAMQTFA